MNPTIDVVNPARPSELVGTAALDDAERAGILLDSAAGAVPMWAALTALERIQVIGDAVDAVAARFPELSETLVRENGKIRREADIDLGGLPGLLKTTATFAEVLEPRTVDSGAHQLVFRRRPYGVVLVLVPFNAPVALAAAHLMPALVAGNTAVVKLPLQCPLVASEVLDQLASALPDGVLNVILTTDDVTARVLVGDPRVRKIGLTGGVRTAVAVLNSVRDVKDFTFELGGNDAAVILDDAEVTDSLAARLTAGAMSLNGQYCAAVKRVYVHRSRLHELTDAMAAAFDQLVVGDGLRPDVNVGPLISAAALERARGLLVEANAGNAKLIESGRVADRSAFEEGYFLRPTLVADADNTSAVVQQEQFAPLLPLVAFDDDATGLAMANDNEYGLCGSVWGADVERAARLADQLEVGIAIVNGTPFDTKDLRTPFGGVKQSGIGRTLAAAGLEAYSGEFVRLMGDMYQAPGVLLGR